MYLESIFIGGDIRQQLPEEAKKFDNIDKTFKKVCIFLHIIMTQECRLSALYLECTNFSSVPSSIEES